MAFPPKTTLTTKFSRVCGWFVFKSLLQTKEITKVNLVLSTQRAAAQLYIDHFQTNLKICTKFLQPAKTKRNKLILVPG